MAAIGFIGTGEIARAMVLGLQGLGHSIFLSERNVKISRELSHFEGVQIKSNQDVIDSSEIIVLCLMADVAKAELPKLSFKPDQRVISVMVDVDNASLQTLCAPVTDISTTIPLPNIADGGCPLPCYPHARSVKELFGAKNPVFEVKDETALNAHFAATAMASVGFAQAQVVAKWLSEFTGDSNVSEDYVTAMLAGFFAQIANDPNANLEESLSALNTEGGLNQTLRKHMQEAGAPQSLEEGLDAFRSRLGLPEKR